MKTLSRYAVKDVNKGDTFIAKDKVKMDKCFWNSLLRELCCLPFDKTKNKIVDDQGMLYGTGHHIPIGLQVTILRRWKDGGSINYVAFEDSEGRTLACFYTNFKSLMEKALIDEESEV
jgi:hypothetical protein